MHEDAKARSRSLCGNALLNAGPDCTCWNHYRIQFTYEYLQALPGVVVVSCKSDQ